MKSFKSILALIISATLITAGVGCKKSPKPPTLIPSGQRPVAQGDTPSGPVNLGGRTTLPPGLGTNTGPTTGGTDISGGTSSNPLPPVDSQTQATRPSGDLPENAEILKAETVYFELDRATVKASERPKLDRVATYLKNNTSAMLRVEGNCDERGTEDYNRSLGERRALAAREYLVNSGVAPERVTTVTYGEDKPADPGHDDAAWSKNRRADFVVLGAPTTTGIQ